MPSKTQSILFGGIILGVVIPFLNVIPVLGACLCCFAYIGAGMLSTWHYTDQHMLTIRGGSGAGMGAASGAIAGFVAAFVTMIFVGLGLFPGADELVRQLDEPELRQQLGQEGVDAAIQLVENYFVHATIIINLIAGAFLGLIGGIIGASVFQKGGDTPQQSAQPPFDEGGF